MNDVCVCYGSDFIFGLLGDIQILPQAKAAHQALQAAAQTTKLHLLRAALHLSRSLFHANGKVVSLKI